MAAKDDSIADDWQDVPDDNFSVVSLPTSEHSTDADPKLQVDKPLATAPSLLTSPASPVAIVSKKLASLSIDDKQDTASNDEERAQSETYTEAEMYGSDLKDALPSEPAYPADDDSIGGLLDVGMDPTFLYKVGTSLDKLISEILSAVCFRRPLSDLKTDILDVCRDLQVHIRELAPIMEGYSKHWNSEKATVNLPIDPGFYEWLSGLKVELLGVQAVILESQMTQASSSSSLSASSGELAAYRTKLKEFHNQIVDFIPIMRSDYDEYHTQNMPLVTDPEPLTPSRQRHSRRNIQADMGLNKGHDHLRRELYALKDQMSACVVSLRRFHPYQPSYRLATFQTLMHSYETIESTLSLMLSNHASDWINYSLEGNITYPEFCRLNPDTIRSLSLQLKEVSESLNATVGLMDSLRYSNDPDDILGDSKQLELRKSDYDTLKVIKEVLTSLFQIRQL